MELKWNLSTDSSLRVNNQQDMEIGKSMENVLIFDVGIRLKE
jgi:hypothetical protein